MRRIAISAAFVGLVATIAIADSTRVPSLELTFEQVTTLAPVFPDLPTLAKNGELFAIEVTGTRASCERWTIDATNGQLSRKGLTLDYHVAVGGLMFDGARLVRPPDGDDGDVSGTCGVTQKVTEHADWLETQGAHLFRTEARCKQAIAKREKVAFVPPCNLADELSAFETDAKSRARFEKILDKGGTLYAVTDGDGRDVCRAVQFAPYRDPARANPDLLQGNVSYTVTSGRRRGKETYGWQVSRGQTEMTILGPSVEWNDGSASAWGCADFVTLSYAKTYVQSFARLHFAPGGCQVELRERQAVERWMPNPDDESRLGDTPLAGGC